MYDAKNKVLTDATIENKVHFVEYLLTAVCKEENYKQNQVLNVVNLGMCDVDLFTYNEDTYAYFYNTDGELKNIVCLNTQQVYMFDEISDNINTDIRNVLEMH